MGPGVEEEAAVDLAICARNCLCPVPKYSSKNAEDEGWYRKAPDDKVKADANGWVNRSLFSEQQVHDERDWVVQEGEDDLSC